jgi:hypothetical protein
VRLDDSSYQSWKRYGDSLEPTDNDLSVNQTTKYFCRVSGARYRAFHSATIVRVTSLDDLSDQATTSEKLEAGMVRRGSPHTINILCEAQ